MTIEELNIKIVELDNKRKEIHDQITPLNKRLTTLSTQSRKLEEQRDVLIIEQLHLKDDEVNFDIILDVANTSRMYKEQERQLKILGFHNSFGHWTDTNQSVISLCFQKCNKEKTNQIYQSILKILPYMKISDDGSKKFQIITEHMYDMLHVYSEDHVELFNGKHKQQSFDNILDALKYCEKHLAYQDEDGNYL